MKKTLFLFLAISANVFAQKLPSISEKTNTFKKFEGFIPFYLDEVSAKIYFEISDFNKEFLYIASLPGGLGSNDIGLDRGLLGDEKLVFFERIGKKVLLTQPNLKFRAITTDPNEARAVAGSFASSIIWGFVAEAEENGKVLVEATEFLQRDAMHVVQRIKDSKQGTYRLDATRTALFMPRTKNFPNNSEFEVTQTFTGGDDAGNYVSTVSPSDEALTLKLHHGFVQLPDNQYKKREFDVRSSFISMSYFDFATPVTEAIDKKYIIRHRLEKKDPTAKISEAIKPIVYYLDNGTPEPIRSALLEGGSWWNQAFEAAGYKDAFQIKLLPTDADPMDCRYNVINWVHRSTRGWSYGNSVIDPRTGEIIKGHVSLGSLRVRQDYLIAQGLLSPFENGMPQDNQMLKMALNRLKQLAAHEIGHTLGLQHNYSASTNGRASVMDYPHPRVKLNEKGEIDLSDAYTMGIGDWDKVSIAYGYQDFEKGKDEKQALNEILDNAISKGLLFLSDQDARPTGSASPTAHLWDNGKDVVEELKNIVIVREKSLTDFGKNTIRKGEPMAILEDLLVPVYNAHRYQIEAVSKLIGGLDYRYATNGDSQFSTKTIPDETQKRALDELLKCLSPSFLTLPNTIIDLIPPRPSGYNSNRELFKKRTGLTFDPLSAAEAAVELPLSLLFHHERANRLVEHHARGSKLGLYEVLSQIHTQLWNPSKEKGLTEIIGFQTQQMELSYLMVLANHENATSQTKAICNLLINDIKKEITGKLAKPNLSVQEKAHLEFAKDRLNNPKDAKVNIYKEMPPGAPIGCD